jgi:hypothetical protein
MTPKEYLGQLYWLKHERKALLAEIDELTIMAGRGTSTYGAQALGGTDRRSKVETAVIRKMECEDKCRETLARMDALEREIIAAIEAVEPPAMRTVLWYRYVRGMSWQTISTAMHYDRATIWRIHGRALQRVRVPPCR